MNVVSDCALIGTSGDLAGVACRVGSDGVMVGRSLEAVLQIRGDGVSRFHARLERSKHGTLVLSDLGSSNGTYVNGRRLDRPQPLEDGDRVRFGPRASFVVRYGGGSARDTAEVMQPIHARATVELLAKRNQGRVALAQGDHATGLALFSEVVHALDGGAVMLAASEDLAEVLIDLARCHVGAGSEDSAVPLCRRAIALLMGSSSGDTSLVRAKFVLGQALLSTEPEDARREVASAAESLERGSALRQELEAWLAVADPAPAD